MMHSNMCGIAGEIRLDGAPASPDHLARMAASLSHRGPDGEGVWIDGPVGLAHRRLSIVDLSEAGAQPMTSADGSVITFNGEIYNYQFLRKELAAQGVRFRSSSDTEVLLALYDREGEAMLGKLRGMFAFAIWDGKRRQLFFARDRFGKKPFFFARAPHTFFFASEVSTLSGLLHPDIDWSAVRAFLGLQYVPAPRTGFVGIECLPPAHFGILHEGKLTLKSYEDIRREPSFAGSFHDACREIKKTVEEAVELRMIADVKVGAFLSGGVDSSILAALMSRLSSERISTFTMGFFAKGESGRGSGASFDERNDARSFAKRFGTDHHEFEARPEHALEIADRVIAQYGVPYADSSGLPTWLLARETSKHVKAVVTGDGGDELFCGYRRYRALQTAVLLKRMRLDRAAAFLSEAWGAWRQDARFTRFAETARGLGFSVGESYAALFSGSYFSAKDEASLLQPDFKTHTDSSSARRFIIDHFDERLGVLGALDFDLKSYLPDDLNVKMDRATMAHGLEARAPFLDQEVVRFAARLPLSFLFKRGIQKPVLAEAFKDTVGADVFRRSKRGFQVPLAAWFRSDLREAFTERCLGSSSPLSGIVRLAAVERLLDANARGADHGNRLWMLFALATWLIQNDK